MCKARLGVLEVDILQFECKIGNLVVGKRRKTRGTQSRPSDPIYESAWLKVAPLTPSLFSRIPVRTQKIPQSHPSDPLNWYLDFCVS